jgi:hypothetical protein
MSALRYPGQLSSIVEDAVYEADEAEITADLDDTGVPGRVGSVTITGHGPSIAINDESHDTRNLDDALEPYGWEVSSIRLVNGGVKISLWEVDE